MEEVFRYDFQWHHLDFAGNKVEEVWTVIVYGFWLEYHFMKSLNDTDSVRVKTMGNKGHDDKQHKHTHTVQYRSCITVVSLHHSCWCLNFHFFKVIFKLWPLKMAWFLDHCN